VKHFAYLSLTVLLLTPLAAPTAQAEEDGPYYVQLLGFMVDAVKNGETVGQVPTTPFLETADKEAAKAVCKKKNRVREALISSTFGQEIEIDAKNQPVYDDLEKRVKYVINKTLRKKLVKTVILKQGTYGMGQGVTSKLPYNSMGCRPIKELPDK